MKQYSSLVVVAIIGLLVVIILSSRIFYTLQPGEKGVVFRPFTTGLDKEHVLKEGFYVIAPWNKLHVYNVKEQKIEESMDVLDKEGLSISVDVSIRFNPHYLQIGFLHEKFGQQYVNTLVVPEVRASVRKIMGRYKAEEVFSTKRKEVEDNIFKETLEILGNKKNNIELTALLIKSIKLPPQIKQAIEDKLKQQQEAEAYKYKINKEKSEAERKRIEAAGIAKYNEILSSSLTDKILIQKGIDATLELSRSANAKVVVVGGGKDGMPLILGNN